MSRRASATSAMRRSTCAGGALRFSRRGDQSDLHVGLARACWHESRSPDARPILRGWKRSPGASPRGGEGGIRTHGARRPCGFQDRSDKPLRHLSAVRARSIAGRRGAAAATRTARDHSEAGSVTGIATTAIQASESVAGSTGPRRAGRGPPSPGERRPEARRARGARRRWRRPGARRALSVGAASLPASTASVRTRTERGPRVSSAAATASARDGRRVGDGHHDLERSGLVERPHGERAQARPAAPGAGRRGGWRRRSDASVRRPSASRPVSATAGTARAIDPGPPVTRATTTAGTTGAPTDTVHGAAGPSVSGSGTSAWRYAARAGSRGRVQTSRVGPAEAEGIARLSSAGVGSVGRVGSVGAVGLVRLDGVAGGRPRPGDRHGGGQVAVVPDRRARPRSRRVPPRVPRASGSPAGRSSGSGLPVAVAGLARPGARGPGAPGAAGASRTTWSGPSVRRANLHGAVGAFAGALADASTTASGVQRTREAERVRELRRPAWRSTGSRGLTGAPTTGPVDEDGTPEPDAAFPQGDHEVVDHVGEDGDLVGPARDPRRSSG